MHLKKRIFFFLCYSLLLPNKKIRLFVFKCYGLAKKFSKEWFTLKPSLQKTSWYYQIICTKKTRYQMHQERNFWPNHSKLYVIVHIFPFKFWQVCAGFCMFDLISMDAGVACTPKNSSVADTKSSSRWTFILCSSLSLISSKISVAVLLDTQYP